MSQQTHLQIDIDRVLRERLPRHYRYIPRWLISLLAKFVCQEQMNRMLADTAGLRDAEFCRGVLDHLHISYTVCGEENLPSPGPDSRVIFVSNHPLGGLDGMTLIEMLTRRLGSPVKFVVNDLLMAVEPLRGVFIPINKHGRQSRGASIALEEALTGPEPIIIFPAGLVSRKAPDGSISDLKWQKMFVNQAIKHGRDIIPIHFSGKNSGFFYNFARLRLKLGLKFNIEMLRLPAEVFRCRDAHFTITVGPRIKASELIGGSQADKQAADIRQLVYQLNPPTAK